MNSDSHAHVLSDEELSHVTGGGLVDINIAVVPQTAIATSTVVILFSDVSNSSIGNNEASTWLSLRQSISIYHP